MNRYVFTLISVCVALFLTPASVYAEEFHVEVNPSILLFNKSKPEQKVTIKNLSNRSIELQPSLYLIKDAGNKNGSVTIENPEKEPIKLEDILTIRENDMSLSTLHLDPLESRQISVIYQPENSTDNKYFTLVFGQKSTTGEPETTTSYSQVISGAGVVILPINEQQTKLDTMIARFESKKIRTSGPITFNAQTRNDTDQLEVVTSTISIRNILNQEVGEITFPNQYLLPHTERQLLQEGNIPTWNDSFLLGPYRATLRIENGEMSREQTINLFVIPVIPLVLVSFILFFSFGVYVKARRK